MTSQFGLRKGREGKERNLV